MSPDFGLTYCLYLRKTIFFSVCFFVLGPVCRYEYLRREGNFERSSGLQMGVDTIEVREDCIQAFSIVNIYNTWGDQCLGTIFESLIVMENNEFL